MHSHTAEECFNAAIRLLTRRDHSCMELSRKLKQRYFQKEHIQATLTRCRQLDYLDDEKFATNYIRQLQRRGYGPRRIRQMLAEKGLERQLISDALNSSGLEKKEFTICRAILEKRLNSPPQGPNKKLTKERLYRFLWGRGFSPEVVRKVLAEVFK